MTSVSRATILVEGVCECDLDKFRDIGPLVCVIIDEKKNIYRSNTRFSLRGLRGLLCQFNQKYYNT